MKVSNWGDRAAIGAMGAVRLAAWSVLAATPAVAQTLPVQAGGEMVVTAGRVAEPLANALRSVVVITAKDIERAGQLTLPQVLQLYGGLEITSNGGHGAASAVFMRGANSAHTLVLVDGMRMHSATSGSTAFENIPLAQIERIEIVPGPVSGLYGSDAIGGVIQIFTRSGRHSPGANVAAGIGSFGTRKLDASFSGAAGATEFTLSAAHFATDGFDATRPTISFDRHNPDDDGYRNSSFTGKLVHRLAPGHEIGASAFHSDGVSRFDNGPGSDDRTEQTLGSYSIHSRNQLTPAWESLLRVGVGRDHSASLDTAFPGEFRTDQDQALWQNTYRLGNTAFIAGLERVSQRIATSGDYAVTRRNIRSAFAGVSADLGRHGVQANVRRDDNSQFGAPTSGSAAYGYRLTDAAKVRVAWGKAFHAPSFNDLYFPGFGNPALRPETSHNREVGFDYGVGAQTFAATYFDNRIEDLIAFVFDPATSIFGPVNVDRARIQGLELSWRGRVFATGVRARFTVQEPEAEATGFLLQRRARRHGSVTFDRAIGAWRLGAELVASGERFDSANERADSRLAGYMVANLTLGRRLSADWSVELRWDNVGDTRYQLVQGYNTPRSNALLSVRWAPG